MRNAVADALHGPIASLAGWVAGEIVEVKAHRAGQIDRLATAQGGLVVESELLFSLEARQLDQAVRKAERVLSAALTASLPDTGPRRLSDAHKVLRRIELGPTPAVRVARLALLQATAARHEADVRAPVTGRVLDVRASAGQFVESGQALCAILRDDYVFVVAIFTAGLLQRLGQARASVLIGAERLGATLQMVAHSTADVAMLVLDSKSRSGLRPGQPASVFIEMD
jgi:multidrug resistance efflux pump